MIDEQFTGDKSSELYLVFGAAGMLGASIVRLLLDRGIRVRTFDIQPISDDRVGQIQGDIRNPEDVRKAVEGVDTVFQTVAIIGWHPRVPDSLYDLNVRGNRNVIEACITASVKNAYTPARWMLSLAGVLYTTPTSPFHIQINTSITIPIRRPLRNKKSSLQTTVADS